MSKIEMLENVAIGEITPYDKNYQNHDKNIEHIKNSIEDFSFDVPIVVDINNVIVKGHGRYEALRQLGYKTIPQVVRNNTLDTPEKASASRIADNESSKAAEVDTDLLHSELLIIGDGFEMIDYGLDLGVSELENGETVGDNKEISMDDLGDEGIIKFKYAHDVYLELIERISTIRGPDQTNEALFIKMIEKYES